MGLCSRGVLPLQDTWRHIGRRIHAHHLKHVDTMDLKSTRSPITTCALKMHLSEKIKGSPCTTWRHQRDAINHRFGISWVDVWKHHDAPIEDQTTEFNHGPYKWDNVSKMGVRRGRKGSIRFSSNDRDSSRSRKSTSVTHGLI